MRRLISCFFLLVMLSAFGEVHGDSITVGVDATIQAWQDSGLYVTASQTLTIAASGTVWYGWFGNFVTATPDGFTSQYGDIPQFFNDCLVPSARAYSLVAKIGGTAEIGTGTLVPEDIPGTGAGFAGSSYSYKDIPLSGELFFAFNDEIRDFGDNGSSFTVTAATVPEPSTLVLLGFGAVSLIGYTWRRRRMP